MLVRTSFAPRSFAFRPGLSGDFDLLQRQLDALFKTSPVGGGYRSQDLSFEPRIAETEEAFILTLMVPGLKPSELEITSTGDELTLKGERKSSNLEGYRVRRQERTPVRFVRRFRMNGRVATDRIDARLTDGVLTVTLPKRTQDQPRTIEVKA